MEVRNLAWNENLSKRCNHPILPKGVRGLIIGKSGCGKATLLINLLLRPGWQNEITGLGISPISIVEEMAKEIKDKSDVQYNFYQSAEDVPDLRELSSEKETLMVFDHLLLEKQNTCESYYVRGRHSNVDCFYFAQNYFKLPRQTIRENANMICLFPQDLKKLNHIFDDHVASDMTKEEFRQLCKTAWEQQHGFVIIDLSSKNMMVSIEVGMMSFTYQIFSLQKWRIFLNKL